MLTKKFSKTKPVAQVKFSLPADAAKNAGDVRVIGDFNNWSWEKGYKMELKQREYIAEVELPAGKEFQFRYLIDNHIWENDWKADAYAPSAFGPQNSVLSLLTPKTATTAEKKAKATPPATTPPLTKASRPAPAKKTTRAAADDLTKIEGVGTKIAELLAKAGIQSFADLSKVKVDLLKGILDKAGSRYKMHDPATWPEQATLAAKGDWAKLDKLQSQLKGGKK